MAGLIPAGLINDQPGRTKRFFAILTFSQLAQVTKRACVLGSDPILSG